MAVNWPQSVQGEKNSRGIHGLCPVIFLTDYFHPFSFGFFPPILILITCLYRQSPCLFMTHLYAPLKTDFIPTRWKQPLLHLPRTLQHENTLVSPGFLRGACLLARSRVHTHTHTRVHRHTKLGMLKDDGNFRQDTSTISLSSKLLTSPPCVFVCSFCVYVHVSAVNVYD